MFKLLALLGWRRRAGDAPEEPGSPPRGAYGDALDAGWVPPPPELPTARGTVLPRFDENIDPESTLSRYYPNQDC